MSDLGGPSGAGRCRPGGVEDAHDLLDGGGVLGGLVVAPAAVNRGNYNAGPASSLSTLHSMGPSGAPCTRPGLSPVLEHCDRQGVRAYLDTTTRNKRLKERHGFQAEDPFAPPGGPPPWPMWWQPASDR
jgi:hypothetical protein